MRDVHSVPVEEGDRTKSPNLNVSPLVLNLSLPNPMKPGVKNEWSTILLPTKVRLTLEVYGTLETGTKFQWHIV